MGNGRAVRRVLAGLGRRPDLWPVALAQAGRLARPGWWRSAPFLPLPDPEYLRFRSMTAYGGEGDALPSGEDLVAYLEWCRAFPAAARAGDE